jgi:tyrosyl-tRNA synthetase
MMLGLKEGQEKMSKSDPDSAVFMEDSVEDVKRKIKRAFCPPGVVQSNPCLDMIKTLVFAKCGKEGWTVKRKAEDGGDVHFADYAACEALYVAGGLHPGDVKANLTDTLNRYLEPIRAHFASGEPKKLLEQVRKFSVTR